MSWGIWLERNKSTFQDVNIPTMDYASKCVAILDISPRSPNPVKRRIIREEVIDKSISWCYFNGVSQGIFVKGGAGVILYVRPMV